MIVTTVLALLVPVPLPTIPTSPSVFPGAAAPNLEVSRWLKGGEVKQLPEKGIAVVEFWATWCGPCRESIPHLTELAHGNKDIPFIGVSLWEDDSGKIDSFVKEMGDKMDYHVGYSSNHAGMARSWMDAAGQSGIPCAFIVKDRVVQWIGDPRSMDETLTSIKEGKNDLAKTKDTYVQEVGKIMAQSVGERTMDVVMQLHESGKKTQANRLLDQFEKANPSEVGPKRIRLLWQGSDDPQGFLATVSKMLANKEPEAVTDIATTSMQLAESPATSKVAAQALALCCDASTDDKPILAYTTAKAYLSANDAAMAKKYAQTGIDSLKGVNSDMGTRLRSQFEKVLKGEKLEED